VPVRNTTFRSAIFFLIVLLDCCCNLRSEPPTLDYLFPAGAQKGGTVSVTNGGKFDPWPPNVWIDSGGIAFKAETNKGLFTVTIDKDARIGPHLVRTYNADGASAPKWFVVGQSEEVVEKEANDSFAQAQPIDKLPVVVNGRLEKAGDVDYLGVKLEAGKWLVAAVDAYALGAPIDANLQLLDQRGARIGFNSDAAQNIDPFLAVKIEKSGTYVLLLSGFAHPPGSDVRYAGSPSSVYRLSLTQGAFPKWVFPAGGRLGWKTKVKIGGWNFESTDGEREWEIDGSGDRNLTTGARLPVPGSNNRLRVSLGDLPEELEKEPNNKPAEAQTIAKNVTINGRIDPAGDEDRFEFQAKKGERIDFRLQSASLGFPLSAALQIESQAGKQLAHEEYRGAASDPSLSWTAPSNGIFRVVVADLFHGGGLDYVYRLEVRAPQPDFRVTVNASSYRLEPGKTNDINLTITRLGGNTNKLLVTALNLPEGVLAKAMEVKAKDKEPKLALAASPSAKPFNGVIGIAVADQANTNLEHRAFFELGPKESRAGEMLINETDQLWLTIGTNKPVAEKVK
jgi:hypothetical protein